MPSKTFSKLGLITCIRLLYLDLNPSIAKNDPFLQQRCDFHRAFDERGLLDLEFHPNFTTNGLFYVLYSHRSNGRHVSRVSEFKVRVRYNHFLSSVTFLHLRKFFLVENLG